MLQISVPSKRLHSGCHVMVLVRHVGTQAAAGMEHMECVSARSQVNTITWWRHQMETFAALLDLCAGNSPVTGEFPSQRPVTWTFDVFFDLRLNKRLNIQAWGWWFETPSCSLWRLCNDIERYRYEKNEPTGKKETNGVPTPRPPSSITCWPAQQVYWDAIFLTCWHPSHITMSFLL